MKTHQLGALGHSYKIVEAPKEDFFGEQSGTKIVLHLREEAQERHPCGPGHPPHLTLGKYGKMEIKPWNMGDNDYDGDMMMRMVMILRMRMMVNIDEC